MNSKQQRATKRKIAGLMNRFESKMVTAKNALERVQVLNEMEDLLQGEITHWHNILADETVEDTNKQENLENNVFTEIQKLKDVIVMIEKQRKELLPEAIQVAQAHKNSHKEVKPTKHVSNEIR